MGRPNHSGGYNTVEEFIAHYGVLGMRWGKRKANSGSTSSAKDQKKLAKADKKWEKNATSAKTYVKVYNAAGAKMNSVEIPRINNKPEYKNADFTSDSPLRRKYYKEFEDSFARQGNAAAAAIGANPSGTKRLKFELREGVDDFPSLLLVDKEQASHADKEVDVEWDAKGHIVKLSFSKELMQSEETDEFLEHYGVPGMKWGVRKKSGGADRPSFDRETGVVSHPSKPGPDGTSRPVNRQGKRISDDAARAAVFKAAAKTAGTEVLSNKQLQDLVTRMNLEQQYSRLSPQTKSQGQAFVESALKVAAPIAVTVFSNKLGPYAGIAKTVVDLAVKKR